ncbi:MAG: acetoacetate--CoA ligase [Bacteroidetes bacterium]|nr:acetoacetate--CoA ligase [Bacteroidota bacterium]
MTQTPPLLWEPDKDFRRKAHLTRYLKWLEAEKGHYFDNYDSLYQWSVTRIEDFWESLWEYFEIISHSPYKQVLSSREMPGCKWFEGSTLNYAEHIFREANEEFPAILFHSETVAPLEISWAELRSQVASMRHFLIGEGVKKGDCVAAYMPNIPEATIAFLAACSIGAIWSSCSPDFGVNSVVDRFSQIKPKVLFTVDGYQYNGKPYDRLAEVGSLCDALPDLQRTVLIPYLDPKADAGGLKSPIYWNDSFRGDAPELAFDPLPFDHPIWVLYSSGTTGIPKAITHSHGGVLLEHLKYLAFHNDVHRGEKFFWFSTTGWMMWNFLQASLLMGATAVIYDGSPGYPNLNALWKFADDIGMHHFGTSAPYLVACMKKELEPGKKFKLEALRSLGSTGAPLPPDAFRWIYDSVKKDLWLCSMAGGTDVCTAFVGGNPYEGVYEGEIQCRALGCALDAWDESGKPVVNDLGEMVITQPMPSMPIYFWGDENMKRYKSSYFEMYPGVWRHGDWIRLTDRGSLVIFGRSDATLNRQGVRIGTAEIYRGVNKVTEIKDSLIVNLELPGGKHYMPLFVVMQEGQELSEEIVTRLKKTLKAEYTPRHVPDEVILAPDIPYTISGKKLEAPVKKILLGMPVGKAANPDSMKNPGSLDFFIEFAKNM